MALDFITAIGNAISGVTGLIKPSIDEHYAQLYDQEHRARLESLETILAQPDSDDRARKLDVLFDGMCIEAGTPAGDISGGQINIPLSHFRAACAIISDDIRQQHKLSKLSFKVN